MTKGTSNKRCNYDAYQMSYLATACLKAIQIHRFMAMVDLSQRMALKIIVSCLLQVLPCF
jgi:hypothetical protein